MIDRHGYNDRATDNDNETDTYTHRKIGKEHRQAGKERGTKGNHERGTAGDEEGGTSRDQESGSHFSCLRNS